MSEGEVIGNFEVNDNNRVAVRLSFFKGKQRIDIRKDYRDKETLEWKPRAGKGINIELIQLPMLVELLIDVREDLVKREILTEEDAFLS